MKSNPLPSQEYLESLFDYHPETGDLTWKQKLNRSVVIGSIAGSTNKRGYNLIQVNGVRYFAHRLIWMLVNGEDPGELEVDHLNRIPSDNRLSNLALVDRSGNNLNRLFATK